MAIKEGAGVFWATLTWKGPVSDQESPGLVWGLILIIGLIIGN